MVFVILYGKLPEVQPKFFYTLPPRPIHSPYVVLGRDAPESDDHMAGWYQLFDERKDILFGLYDLRVRLGNDTARPFPGVVLAPPHYYQGPPVDTTTQPSYFLTFRGYCKATQQVRPQMYSAWQHFRGPPDVVVEWTDGKYNKSMREEIRYNELLNSAFIIVPHGDGRWSYRFSEVLGACSIPVVLADGLDLPFSQLIDWKEAAVQLNETFAWKPEQLITALPRDPKVVHKMRARACEIYEEHFATSLRRWNAVIESALVFHKS